MNHWIKGVESFDGNPVLGQSQPLHPHHVQRRAQPLLSCLHWQRRTFWVGHTCTIINTIAAKHKLCFIFGQT